MNTDWQQELSDALGKRYELKIGTEKTAVLYRSAKSEYKPSRVSILAISSEQPVLELQVDLRIPKSESTEEAERMLQVFERVTASPRGFARQSDETNPMVSHAGKASGWARSLIYRAQHKEAKVAAKHIRALVENLDIPIILGIHDDDDLVAKDPRPLLVEGARSANLPMELWRFRLQNSLLRDLSLIVDPNVRTLKVCQRAGFSTQQVGETVGLARIGRFELKRGIKGISLIAYARDETPTILVENGDGADFEGTAHRMAAKVRIPITTHSEARP
jgi:hypothetical protein